MSWGPEQRARLVIAQHYIYQKDEWLLLSGLPLLDGHGSFLFVPRYHIDSILVIHPQSTPSSPPHHTDSWKDHRRRRGGVFPVPPRPQTISGTQRFLVTNKSYRQRASELDCCGTMGLLFEDNVCFNIYMNRWENERYVQCRLRFLGFPVISVCVVLLCCSFYSANI